MNLLITILFLMALLTIATVICASIAQRRAKPCEHALKVTAREYDGTQTLVFYRCTKCGEASTTLHDSKPIHCLR